jgi:rfaE bifunctional protein nucleotidyltransferase chain/domain
MKNRVVTIDELLGIRQKMRESSKKVVFTNGCFDLLHPGHVQYLEAAREHGDLLFVAINSDKAVRELKGPGRPIVGERERALILAGLRAVDYVTIFDDLSPRGLIARLLPDVLVKGGDYQLDQIHGREEVERAGGQVLSIPFLEGMSTSAIIERIRENG